MYLQTQTASADAGVTSALSDNNGVRVILGGGSGVGSFIVENGSSESLRINRDGNVGIGTTSPSHMLDITTSRSGNGQGSTIRINRPDNSSYENAINWATNGTSKWFLGSDNDSTENFYLYNWAAGAFALTVQGSNNNVGIGTTSPDELLHVAKTSGDTVVAVEANAGNAALYLTSAGSGKDNRIVSGNGKDLKFETQTTGTGQGQGQDPVATGTTVMTLTPNGDLTLQGSIKFNGDTAAANALDDYEEGDFTPAYGHTSGTPSSVTYDSQTYGHYTKIGNVVHCQGRIRTDSINWSSSTLNTVIKGFPFTCSSPLTGGTGCVAGIIGFASGFGQTIPVSFQMRDGTSEALLYGHGVNVNEVRTYPNIQSGDFETGSEADSNTIVFQITYRTT